MKRIVFNGCWAGKNVVGVSRYAYNILRELDKLLDNSKDKYCVNLLVPANANEHELCFKNIVVVKKGQYTGPVSRIIWEQIIFPIYVKKTKGIGVDLTLSIPVRGVKYIAIHDCIYESFPENYKGHEIHRAFYIWRVKKVTAQENVQIITVSNESRKEIVKYYGVAPNRITVIGNGWEHMKEIHPDESVFEKCMIDIGKPYFFALGSKYRHKNLAWIITAAQTNPEYTFVLTGNDSFSNESEELQKNSPDNVIFTGFVSDEEMKALMLHCLALIQPSLHEGFGIPPLEALSLGKKIIVSKASCLPEIYEDSAIYIDPNKSDVDMDALMQEHTGDARSVLEKHSWKKSAYEMLKLIGS
ncbi:glycosyltransferase family 4 protein [Oscillospiraceae bacterium HV4-5-C5C]|nr:glycosyltransferase family 4 protein [Oscillospiraceae bacterium HV4-5-C5C]